MSGSDVLFRDLLSLLQGLPIFNSLFQHFGTCFPEDIHAQPCREVVPVISVKRIHLLENVLWKIKDYKEA